uniref:Uncharacterized protein n=1 Tax=Xiphophorus couchianus TaxID=32473 RepID=A0A3B5L2P0_9TELE
MIACRLESAVPVLTSSLRFSQLADLQLTLAQTEKNYFEAKLKLERLSGENQSLLQENKSQGAEKDELRLKLSSRGPESSEAEQSCKDFAFRNLELCHLGEVRATNISVFYVTNQLHVTWANLFESCFFFLLALKVTHSKISSNYLSYLVCRPQGE